MKDLAFMYGFRIFVVSLILTYTLLNVTNLVVIGFVLLGLVFLVLYYSKYLKKIFWKNSYYYLIIGLSIILAIFVCTRNNTKVIFEKQNLKIVVVRDTILDNEINVTLGKIVNSGIMKGKLIIISSDILTEFKIGQVLNIYSKIEKNKYLANPFDMVFFGKVDYQASFPEVEIIGNISGNYFFRMISFVRNMVDKKIKDIFGLKNYSLFSMWILGETKTSDKELNNTFKDLGVSHILVVSGTHLTILFNIVSYLLLFLPMGYLGTIILSIMFLIVFLFLSGFSSSILRATVFWMVVAIGKINGKIINYTNVLLISLLGFFVLNPKVIVYDIGFHLSFLSIVALVYVTPLFNNYWKSNRKYLEGMISVFKASLAVTIVLLPYLVYIFKDFNLMSLFFNIVLIPVSGVILGSVFLVVLVGMIVMFMAKILGLVVNYAGSIFVWSLKVLDNLSLKANIFLFNSIFFVIIYYIVLGIIVIDFYINHKELTINI